MSGGGRDRLYWRDDRQGWYMDLRDLGHGQRACIPEGERTATEDRDQAVRILSDKLDEIENGEEDSDDPRLESYAADHLEKKRRTRAESTVQRDDRALRNIIAHLGGGIRLSEIGVEELDDYWTERLKDPGRGEGETISSRTVQLELTALSDLYERAISEGKAEQNPVRAMHDKPRPDTGEAVWLESGEATRLLAAAEEYDRDPHPRATHPFHPVLATFLYTGGRASEVYGLERRDVDLEAGVVHFRPNRHRGLKRDRKHRRRVPLWSDLEVILRDYLDGRNLAPRDLLFEIAGGGMIGDVRGLLSTLVENAGIEDKRVTPHTFRHTYAAARIQTLDHGEPVSIYTVAQELGHTTVRLIEETYGHLQSTRHRAAEVEYREADVVDMEREERAG